MSEQLPTGIRRKSKNSLEIRVKHNNKTYYGYAQTVVEAIRIKAELKAKLKTNNVNAISCNYDTGRNEAMKEDNKVRVDFSKLEKELELQNKSKSQLSYEIGRSSAYISGIKNGKIPRNIEALICKTLNRTPGYFVLKEEAASNDNAAELLKRIVESNSVIIEKLNVLSERVAIVEDMYEKAIKTESVLESNAVFRRDGKEIRWPEQTHSADGIGFKKWKPCGDYIDWSDLGSSIFERKKPLAEATQKRIANGIKKYIIDAESPYIVRSGEALAYIIQYHGETRAGDSRGQLLTEPIKTIDTSNRYGLVTAFITKYYKTGIGQGCDEPLHTITTSPGHFGLVSAFLIKYYGGGCGQTLNRPLDTITTKDRFGLVNVILDIKGEKYIISDIFLRMLKPEELKVMQGFPKDYIIDRDYNWKKYPIAKQVARIGNSVVPIMAEKLVEANCPYLKVGERVPNLIIDDTQEQLRFA